MGADNSLRYIEMKNRICQQIYNGTYKDEEKIPSERQLTELYEVSRITVRKALEILEEEGLVRREVGCGTKITLKNQGNENPMDLVALVAPSQVPFFSKFIAEFQKCMWEHNGLLLYVEIPTKSSLEDCLYSLYCKNIRNVVVWPDDKPVQKERLRRLRGIGMNLVFFDTDDAMPYADCVYLDNEDAIKRLLKPYENKNLIPYYFGWDNMGIANNRKREKEYKQMCPEGSVMQFSWNRKRVIEEELLKNMLSKFDASKRYLCVCGAGEIERQIRGYIENNTNLDGQIYFAVIDDYESSYDRNLSVYNQDLKATAEKIYLQLQKQVSENEFWKASKIKVKGNYIC